MRLILSISKYFRNKRKITQQRIKKSKEDLEKKKSEQEDTTGIQQKSSVAFSPTGSSPTAGNKESRKGARECGS